MLPLLAFVAANDDESAKNGGQIIRQLVEHRRAVNGTEAKFEFAKQFFELFKFA